MEAVAKWLKQRSRDRESGDRAVKFSTLKSQLIQLGCEFKPPRNNFVKISRRTESGTRSTKIGYPRSTFDVGLQDIKKIRHDLQLDDTHGIDSAAFYEDMDAVVDKFINQHRQVLDRLALT